MTILKIKSSPGLDRIAYSIMLSGFTNGDKVVDLFLDLKGAFPNVIPQIRFEDPKDIAVPWQVARCIHNPMYYKFFYFKSMVKWWVLDVVQLALPSLNLQTILLLFVDLLIHQSVFNLSNNI